MNQQQLSIFHRALNSQNPIAIAQVAQIFHKMGEIEAARRLMANSEKYSAEYTFGVDYSAVQRRLNELGASPQLTVDGQWGPKSQAALKAFQGSKALTVDGVPGPNTLKALGLADTGTVASTMGNTVSSSSSVDAQAYTVAQKAGKEMGLTDREIQYVLTVARGEGYYGRGWANPSAKTKELSAQFGLTGYEGANSNNWGAVQGTGNAGSFKHVDVHADGSPYTANYKKYLTPEDGFKDMAKIILGGGKRKAAGAAEIKSAIAAGNLRKAVFAQHANGYFELYPEKYLAAVLSNYNKIMAGIGWPKILAENGVTPGVAGVGGLILFALGAGALLLLKQRVGITV